MTTNQEIVKPVRPRKVIFSFAAYAKEIISILKSSSNVHVTPGLTPSEISTVECAAGIVFPPDLRSILSEGLPVGPGFPNWRSSSRHELCLLTSLPALSLVKEVNKNNFWATAWGLRPENDEEAVAMARKFLENVPRLVPVFRHCYIPCEPSLAGNPVFYVHGGEVRMLSIDVGEFYKTPEFWKKNWVLRHDNSINRALKIDFWTSVSETGGSIRRKGWWSGKLGERLEDAVWRLREGGWGEDDVREMMMMDGSDDGMRCHRRHVRDVQGVVRHVRSLSTELLRSGWSLEDVVYSLGDQVRGVNNGIVEGENNWVDIHCHCGNENSLVLSR